MSPSSTLNNVTDSRNRDTEVFPNLSVAPKFFIDTQSDKTNPVIVKSGMCMANAHRYSILGFTVRHVRQLITLKQMKRITTRRVIAFMKNAHRVVNCSVVKFISDTVGKPLSSTKVPSSVSMLVSQLTPRPTCVEPSGFINALPESFNGITPSNANTPALLFRAVVIWHMWTTIRRPQIPSTN